jgi:hypothetical protein
MMKTPFLMFCIWCAMVVSPSAQTASEQAPTNEQLQQRIEQLEKELQSLKEQVAARPAAPAAQPAPAAPGVEIAPETATPQAGGQAQEPPQEEEKKPTMDIYGFAQLDLGYNFGQTDPAWFDVVRPTKLPSFHNEFQGRDGSFFASVRQTRFGVKSTLPTDLGDLKTIFEFELFGTGVDAGQTTFRLRHAWGELGQFGAGQTWSPFMDPDVFPNSLEYWGPNGMVFFRNVQLRWQPINKGNKQLWIALERPGATADNGPLTQRIQLAGVTGRFPAPDVSARIRWGGERGHIQLAGIGRYIAWDDPNRSVVRDLSGHIWGWGFNLSSNIPLAKKDVIKLSATYGHGIENYMNDAPVDVAPSLVPNLRTPVTGDALPVFGMVAFYDKYWSERWSSTIGYSMLNIENTGTQVPSSFHRGHYGLANLLFYPTKNVMTGGEFQWGRRENFADGFIFDDYRIQFSAKYNFDYKLGGAK